MPPFPGTLLRLLLPLALSTGPLLAESTSVEVVLALRGKPADQKSVPVVIRAVPSSPGSQAQAVETNGSAPGSVRLELDGSQIWQISAQAESFWSAGALASPSAENPSLTVDLWPAGRLAGSILTPPGQAMPRELSVRFRPSPEKGANAGEEHTLTCPVVEGRWDCQLPSRKLDLRLRARGFVSLYRWGVTVPAGGTLPLGALSLQRGASVVGRVEAEEGAVSVADCRVELSPMVSGAGGLQEDLERRSGLTLSAKVDERGFFHFEGVKPGAYVLSARQPGFAPAEIYPVSVLETSESDVRQPLLLRRPAALAVTLDPPLDPWNQPWRVLLFGRSVIPGSLSNVSKGEASREGRFIREGLSPGEYAIEVQDEQGSSYAWQDLRLERGAAPLEIRLPLVWVAGKVELGDEPLPAQLWFGGRNGRRSVLMRSGEDGGFEGALPSQGDWEVDVAASSPWVERRLPKVTVKLLPGADTAKVAIELPATHLSGEVVDDQGKRVPRAEIMTVDPEALHPVALNADDEGRFELAGLPEGTLILSAKKSGLKSDEVAVSLSESSEPPPVRLVLRKLREVTGVLASPAGGLPGVKVFAMAPDRNSPAALPFSVHAITDVEGRFRLEVPDKATDLLLTAMPPGYTLFTRQWRGLPESPLLLTVEAQGGSLRLVPKNSEDAPDSQVVVIVNGVFLDSIVLGAWASLQGERNADPDGLVVPQMPPAAYTACWVSTEEAWNAFRFGGFSAMASCASGTLSPGGELALERPKSERSERREG